MTLTIHDDIEQRSEQWLELRRGMVTASLIGQLISSKARTAIDFDCPACDAKTSESCLHKRTGQPVATLHSERAKVAKEDTSPPVLTIADGKTTRDLAGFLAAERIAGIDPDGTFVTRDMYRGSAIEDPARELYASHYGVKVTEVGFMVREEDGYSIGVSPDGLVGDDGGIEIKSPRHKGHLLTAASGVVPDHHIAQIQTALYVSGRDWWDFVDYAPGMHLWVKRVLPDPEWFKAIDNAVRDFEHTIQQLVNDYQAAVEGFPMTDALPDPNLVELTLA